MLIRTGNVESSAMMMLLTLTAPEPTLVYRRQILTTKVDPGTVRVKLFIKAVYL